MPACADHAPAVIRHSTCQCCVMASPTIRPAEPSDYDRIVAVIDDWWGRPVRAVLPRLFLDHFAGTSLVAKPHAPRRHEPRLNTGRE